MTKTGTKNPKQIVANDYQQFLAHFEWFVSLYQISDVKHEFLQVKQKLCKNCIFWAKNLVFENFPGLYVFPPLSKLSEKNFTLPFTFYLSFAAG